MRSGARLYRSRPRTAAAAALGLGVLLGACGPVTSPSASGPAGPSSAGPAHSRSASTQTATAAAGRGDHILAGDVVLPSASRTPGAVSAAVTQANIGDTICRTGYTKTIRPPSEYTTSLKKSQLASGYTYHGDTSTGDYEEDHLISLELGGAPRDPRNLWPEPYSAAEGARVKDRIENQLHDLVCSGKLRLSTAQHAIAVDWWAAYQRYGGEGAPRVWAGTYTGGGSSPTPAPSATAPAGATAQCVDGTYSYSQHLSGTCSHHGGVARWISKPSS